MNIFPLKYEVATWLHIRIKCRSNIYPYLIFIRWSTWARHYHCFPICIASGNGEKKELVQYSGWVCVLLCFWRGENSNRPCCKTARKNTFIQLHQVTFTRTYLLHCRAKRDWRGNWNSTLSDVLRIFSWIKQRPCSKEKGQPIPH